MSFLSDIDKHRVYLRRKIAGWKGDEVFHECDCEYCDVIEGLDLSPEEVEGAREHYIELINEAKRTLVLLDRYELEHTS